MTPQAEAPAMTSVREDVMKHHEAAPNTRLMVFDIETYRTRNPAVLDRIRAEAAEKQPASNTRKELKMAWHTEAAREERSREAVAKTSQDPLIAEPLVVCWEADGEPYFADMMSHPEREQLALLVEWWDSQTNQETIWCGHNICGFDLPILLNRWRHHRITPPEHFPQYRHGKWRGRVWDTMLRTPSKNGLGMVGLRDVCEAYGVSAAKDTVYWRGAPMDGSRVAEAFEAGEYELIVNYCADDVSVQRELYMRQTANDTWGTFDRHSDLAEQVLEIQQAKGLSEGARAIAILKLLESNGLMPRGAAA